MATIELWRHDGDLMVVERRGWRACALVGCRCLGSSELSQRLSDASAHAHYVAILDPPQATLPP